LVRFGFAVLLLCDASTTFAQVRTVGFGVDKIPQPGGDTIYRIAGNAFGHTFFGVPTDAVTLTMPDGTILPRRFETDYATFDELAADVFGDWTVTEIPTSGPNNTYIVRIAPFTLADVNSATPVVTSPIPGSTVPTDFIVKWEPYAATSSKGVEAGAPGVRILDYELGADGPFSIGFETELLQPAPVRFPFVAFVQTPRPNPVIRNRSPALIGTSISSFFAFNSRSLLAEYFVVPEPSALGVTAIATIAIGRRRTRNRDR
jgi:hypothetical protein